MSWQYGQLVSKGSSRDAAEALLARWREKLGFVLLACFQRIRWAPLGALAVWRGEGSRRVLHTVLRTEYVLEGRKRLGGKQANLHCGAVKALKRGPH